MTKIGSIINIVKKKIKTLLKKKDPKLAKFNEYINKDPAKLDNDLLITSLCYHGHHVDKITKCNYKENLGISKYRRLEKLFFEFKQRKLNNTNISNWISDVLNNYDRFAKTRKKILNTESSELKPLNQSSIIDFILNRASVRFWQPRVVEQEKINKIIEAGINGPVSCNRHPFKVGIKMNTIDKIERGEAKNSSLLYKAPLKLYVAIDERLYREKYACALDCGSFCSHALLAANSLGIEGCWIYGCEALDQVKLRNQFNLPKHYYFYSILLLGYPEEKPEKPARRKIGDILTEI